PARLDNENTINALRELKLTFMMQDTWRNENPTKRLFTFNSNHQTLSRLDRIYTAERHATSMIEWSFNISQILTDHHMITIRFAPPRLPHIGNGRWPVDLLIDKDLIKQIISIGLEMQQKIDEIEQRTDLINLQTMWKEFKSRITSVAKDTTKKHLARINQCIKALTKDLRRIANLKEIDTSENTRINRSIVEREIDHFQQKQNKKEQLKAQAQWAT
ncbi:hypothetical protein P692DRAFT_20729893, partial [Suillus brevipes Sb2]